MKIILNSWRHHYLTKVGIFLITAALIVGMVGCDVGDGATPPSPAWGLMINEGREYISAAPWAVLAPSIAMASLVITLSFFTEGLSLPGGRRTQSRIGR